MKNPVLPAWLSFRALHLSSSFPCFSPFLFTSVVPFPTLDDDKRQCTHCETRTHTRIQGELGSNDRVPSPPKRTNTKASLAPYPCTSYIGVVSFISIRMKLSPATRLTSKHPRSPCKSLRPCTCGEVKIHVRQGTRTVAVFWTAVQHLQFESLKFVNRSHSPHDPSPRNRISPVSRIHYNIMFALPFSVEKNSTRFIFIAK